MPKHGSLISFQLCQGLSHMRSFPNRETSMVFCLRNLVANNKDRDLAVGILRSAGLQHEDAAIWASPDRPPTVRAARNFLFGLKYNLKSMGLHYTLHVNENTNALIVGGETAVTVNASSNKMEYAWHGAWATWQELLDSGGVKSLQQNAEELLQRSGMGTKGSSKGVALD
eukprot:TRINITY_DN22439_c0_g1_i1.p1 TRINITY_DN22439_c0_g1~~TRINITY_DN22439_c0_g1_i1.p1  ORF type:complete len:170 (-),score=16.04 TRINITY_DN22439_c0_g1_i1:1662-2171(-)